MRLLYASRTSGVHDQRFLEAWRSCGFEVEALEITSAKPVEPDAFLDRIAEFRPDVVQVGPITAPGPLVAALWKGPLIATSWAFDLLREAEESSPVRTAAVGVLRRADVIFVDSKAVHDRAVAFGADPAAIIQFPWGIGQKWLERTPEPRGMTGPFVFLSTRRHEALYRVGDVISAFLGLAAEFPRAELWIASSGSLTRALREQADGASVGDRIRFIGELPEAALRKLYAAADVYISCSVVDGASISLLEAMASGAIPIVSDIPGNREWVGRDVGFRYPVGDVAQLRVRMLATARLSPRVREGMARRAFDRIRELADWDRTRRGLPQHADLAMKRHQAALARDTA